MWQRKSSSTTTILSAKFFYSGNPLSNYSFKKIAGGSYADGIVSLSQTILDQEEKLKTQDLFSQDIFCGCR